MKKNDHFSFVCVPIKFRNSDDVDKFIKKTGKYDFEYKIGDGNLKVRCLSGSENFVVNWLLDIFLN